MRASKTVWIAVLGIAAACNDLGSEVQEPTSGGDATSAGLTTSGPGTGPGPTSGPSSATMDGSGTSNGPGTTGADTTMGTNVSASATTRTTDESTSEEGTTEDPPDEGTSTGEPIDCDPILSEIMYDPAGTEVERQWVQIYNNCPIEIDMSNYSLGWGGVDYTVGTKDLQGMVAAGDCYLVGGPLSDADNGDPMYDWPSEFLPELERSEGNGTADGVALFDMPAAMITPATIPIDAVIYGETNPKGLLDNMGGMPMPHVEDAASGESIRRTGPNTWIIDENEMPNACPVF